MSDQAALLLDDRDAAVRERDQAREALRQGTKIAAQYLDTGRGDLDGWIESARAASHRGGNLMAVCAKCGAAKLTERPCPRCGNSAIGSERSMTSVTSRAHELFSERAFDQQKARADRAETDCDAAVRAAELCARCTPERDHNGVLCRKCANEKVGSLVRERDQAREALRDIKAMAERPGFASSSGSLEDALEAIAHAADAALTGEGTG